MPETQQPTIVGLVVNPVAGMGGSVGLKGTDGAAYERAVALGAQPVSPVRASALVGRIKHLDDIVFLAGPGNMGEEVLASAGATARVVGQLDGQPEGKTTPEDTMRIARAMVNQGAALVVAVGGDGTLRDVCEAIGTRVPVVAVPAGVKVYSSAFAVNARAAARMVDLFVDGVACVEAEVLDIDEAAYREGRLEACHFGYVLVPDLSELVQGGKESTGAAGEGARRDAAGAVADSMTADRLYLLGPGTTVRAITDALGLPKTLLGVDAVVGGRLVGSDLNERAILALLTEYRQATIVVTPLGGNGFVLGRGNRQFTPAVIREVGTDNLVIVAGRDKALALACLRVDTGDAALDAMLSGYREIITGSGHTRVMRIA